MQTHELTKLYSHMKVSVASSALLPRGDMNLYTLNAQTGVFSCGKVVMRFECKDSVVGD